MEIVQFMKSYAEEISGDFCQYDEQVFVIIVPLEMERQQTVICEKEPQNGLITIYSKVCPADNSMPFRRLLEENHQTLFGKFTLDHDFLKVVYRVGVEDAMTNTLKKAIVEMAQLADTWEMKLTGKDVF